MGTTRLAVDRSLRPRLSWLDRRQFLRAMGAGLGGLGLSGCIQGPISIAVNIPGPIIDAHCHVFNASDLPVAGFIEAVILQHHEDQAEARLAAAAEDRSLKYALIELLLRIVQSGAPTAREEIVKLTSLASERSPRLTNDTGDETENLDRDQQILGRVLPEIDERRGAAVLPALRREAESVMSGRALLLEQLFRELDESGAAGRAVRTGRARIGEFVPQILLCQGYVCRHIRWAFGFLRFRYQIANRMRMLYAPAGGGVDLFTPTLIDLTHWLRDDAPPSSLEDQIRVMDLVQQTRQTSRLQCFMAFDPLRQILDAQGATVTTPREMVEKAIFNTGFVGVKLYPPMGFRPAGNTEQGLTFPERVLEEVRALGVQDFPARLDRTLDELYAWCVQHRVAILAHATDSQEAAQGYGLRADPRFWGMVLERHETLQLNMGHFGGFDEGFNNDDQWTGPVEKTWEWRVGEMIKDGRFPNVVADLSYLSELLVDTEGGGDRADAVREFLPRFIREFDPELRHLVYGSDWIMLGREPKHREYIVILHDTLREFNLTDVQLKRFFGGNAARFLGLRQGGRTRARLESYDMTHGLDPAFWMRFNAAPGT